MNPPWLVLACAAFAGAVGSFGVRAFARRFGIVNHPNPLVPQHVVATPYLGGVGVLTGISAGIVAGVVTGLELPRLYVLLPAVLFCALGTYDDLAPLNAAQKLVAQIAVAILAVILGLRARVFGVEFLDAAFAVLWIVTCVNAFNVTDVCDGLVTGLAAVFFLCAMTFWQGNMLVATAAFGACAGFLLLNAPRASIFLGDAGSHLLGFLVAVVALDLPPGGAIHLPVLCLAVSVPLAELAFVTVLRLRKGLPWYKGSPDHFALRLQRAGWSRWRVDLAAWFTMACATAAAVVFAQAGAWIRVAILLAVAGFGFVVVRFLLRHEVTMRR